jgi:hypothetical protein
MSALAAELDAIALGDLRLNRRARRLLEKLGEKPTLSIPAACGGWDETRAAYRLFDHPEVSAERVLAPHIACTEQRLREHPRVLCIQDTTELDYTTKKGIAGLGPLNYETRWGMYLHPTLAVTPDRVPLGLLDLHSWAREPGSLGKTKTPTARSKRRKACVGSTASPTSTNWPNSSPTPASTYIADREGDIYDLFVEAPCPEQGADWLVRVNQQDRLLDDGRKLRAKSSTRRRAHRDQLRSPRRQRPQGAHRPPTDQGRARDPEAARAARPHPRAGHRHRPARHRGESARR